MCGGGSQTVQSTSGPPVQFLNAYQQVLGQAANVAAQPLQQYPIGPDASNIVAPLQPNQQQAIGQIENQQGLYWPYINAAQAYTQAAATPIQPMQFAGVENLPGWGIGSINAAQTWSANLPNDIAPYLATATMGNPQNYASNIGNYFNPYQQYVTQGLQNLFNQQNATQFNQIRGNAAAQGAFGGDREAVAEAQAAGQQQLSEAPILANVQQQGYAQAQQEMNAQQQLGLSAGQLENAAQQEAAQMQLAAGQGLLGEFNTQQQAGIGAQEATGWLNQGAGYGMANLAQEQQNLGLAGSNALLSAGGLQQAQAQQILNAPYEQFIQQQAYPFQTTGWLANIAEGLGGASGGTGTTTYPGPSTLSQLTGAGLAGTGILGMTGAFGNTGWLTGTGSLFGPPAVGLGGTLDTAGNAVLSGAGEGSLLSSAGLPLYHQGGRVTNPGARLERASGGDVGLDRYAPGGGVGVPLAPTGVPDLTMSIVPGAQGLGVPPAHASGALHSAFTQPVTTQTQSGGGGGLGSIIGPALLVAKVATLAAADGGTVPNTGSPGSGGTLSPPPPDLSKSFVPGLQAPPRLMGPPTPPQAPRNQPNPVDQAVNSLSRAQGLSHLFNGSGASSGSGNGLAAGGTVTPSATPIPYQGGGPVPPEALMMAGAASNPEQQMQAQFSLVRQYAQMPIEKLREMAVRFPPSSPLGAAIQRAIQIREMSGGSAAAAASPAGPIGASGQVVPGTTAADGGRMGLAGYAGGGDVMEPASDETAGANLWRIYKEPLDVPVRPNLGQMWTTSERLRDELRRIHPGFAGGGMALRRFDDGGDIVAEAPIPGTDGGLLEPPPDGNLASDLPPPDTDDIDLSSPFPPGSVKYNSRGEPYSPELDTMPPQDKANAAASMRFIQDHPTTWADLPAGMPAAHGTGSDALATGHGGSNGARSDYGSNPDPRGLAPFIAQTAAKYGVDPLVALRVAGSEGLRDPVGDNGTSFGAFQLHVHGGLGDEFRRQTGLDPSDPRNERATIDWALRNVSKTGWAPYHGAANTGIGSWEGIGDHAADTSLGLGAPPGDTIEPPPAPATVAGADQPQSGASRSGVLDAVDRIVKDIGERGKTGANIYGSPYLPLIAAGLGMMASRSPYPGVAIGEGGLTGLKMLEQQQAQIPKNEMEKARADMTRLSVALMPQQMKLAAQMAGNGDGTATVPAAGGMPVAGAAASGVGDAITPTAGLIKSSVTGLPLPATYGQGAAGSADAMYDAQYATIDQQIAQVRRSAILEPQKLTENQATIARLLNARAALMAQDPRVAGARTAAQEAQRYRELRGPGAALIAPGGQIVAQSPQPVDAIDPATGRKVRTWAYPAIAGTSAGERAVGAPSLEELPTAGGAAGTGAARAEPAGIGPAQPGQGIPIELGPGEHEALVARAQQEQKDRQTTLADAQAAQNQQTTLMRMMEDAPRFTQGPFANVKQEASRYLRLIDPSFNGQVASFEDFVKNANTLTRQATREVSPRAAFQELQFISAGLPNPEMSPNGLKMVIGEYEGLNDYRIAKARAQQEWEQAHGGTGHVEGFESTWQATAPVTPYTFVLRRMDPGERQALFAKWQQTPEGQAVLKRLARENQYALEHGLYQ